MTTRLWIQMGASLVVHWVSALLVAVALLFVIPSFIPIFADFGAVLPSLTRLSIGLSDGARSLWFLSIPAAVAIGLVDVVVLYLLGRLETQLPYWVFSLGVFFFLGILSITLFASMYLPMFRLA